MWSVIVLLGLGFLFGRYMNNLDYFKLEDLKKENKELKSTLQEAYTAMKKVDNYVKRK